MDKSQNLSWSNILLNNLFTIDPEAHLLEYTDLTGAFGYEDYEFFQRLTFKSNQKFKTELLPNLLQINDDGICYTVKNPQPSLYMITIHD